MSLGKAACACMFALWITVMVLQQKDIFCTCDINNSTATGSECRFQKEKQTGKKNLLGGFYSRVKRQTASPVKTATCIDILHPQAVKAVYILVHLSAGVTLVMLVAYFIWKTRSCCMHSDRKTNGQSPPQEREVKMTDEEADQKINDLVATNSMIALDRASPEAQQVENVVMATWQNTYRGGRDSRNLSHTGISVKGIYRCTKISPNQPVDKKSSKVHGKSSRCSYKEPPCLQSRPFLTKNISHVEPPEIQTLTSANPTDPESQETTENMSHDEPLAGVHAERVSENHRHEQQHEPSLPSYKKEKRSISEASDTLLPSSSQCTIEMKHTPCQSTNSDFTCGKPVYLFHGTKVSNLPSILDNNLNLKYAKSGLYGKAMYFAESSEKADQYADSRDNRRMHNLTILLFHVHLGRIQEYWKDKPVKRSRWWPFKRKFDSVIVGHMKRFREVLTYDPNRCRPKYVIVYDRIVSIESPV